MGRYFNDDLVEDQNDDPDAYLEHYGIPKIKWDPQVRSKFDALHHKTEDSIKKAKLHANSIGKQAKRSISDLPRLFGKKKKKKKKAAPYTMTPEQRSKINNTMRARQGAEERSNINNAMRNRQRINGINESAARKKASETVADRTAAGMKRSAINNGMRTRQAAISEQRNRTKVNDAMRDRQARKRADEGIERQNRQRVNDAMRKRQVYKATNKDNTASHEAHKVESKRRSIARATQAKHEQNKGGQQLVRNSIRRGLAASNENFSKHREASNRKYVNNAMRNRQQALADAERDREASEMLDRQRINNLMRSRRRRSR